MPRCFIGHLTIRGHLMPSAAHTIRIRCPHPIRCPPIWVAPAPLGHPYSRVCSASPGECTGKAQNQPPAFSPLRWYGTMPSTLRADARADTISMGHGPRPHSARPSAQPAVHRAAGRWLPPSEHRIDCCLHQRR